MKHLFFVIFVLLTGCSSYSKYNEYNEKAPSGFTEVVTARKLAKMKPVDVLNLLKTNCCDGVMFEPGKVNWKVSDVEELQNLVDDKTEISPVATIMSSVSCRGGRYVSNVGREVQHLILAVKAGKYPLAQCSTYDLRLEKK